MYKRIFSLAIVLSFLQLLHAQAYDSTGMVVHKNSHLDVMMKKQFAGTTTKTPAMGTAKSLNYKVKRQGYRVLVLNTNDRNLTYKTKGQLLGRYPNQQLYTVYQAPFFKLKMGDFISRNEAENLRDELAKIMPKGVFIIHDEVYVKPEEEAKL